MLFAIPPILTNTYIGVSEVEPAAVDAARGMGMSGPQVLAKVELPLSVPLLMDGVRLAAVQVIATATIAALVAGGGLGALITDGFARQNQAEVVAGALFVVVLALSVEGLMALLQRRANPLPTGRGPADPGRTCHDRVRTVIPTGDAREGRRRLGRYSG